VLLANEEGEAVAVAQMADLLNAIAGLIEHMAGQRPEVLVVFMADDS
jgi:hypothetical protein